MLTIQHLQFNVVHIKGSENVADAFSRNSPASEEELVEYTICFLMKELPVNLKQIAEETAKDDILAHVVRAIEVGWSTSQSSKLTPYPNMRDDLTLER